MKKCLVALMLLVLALALVACSSGEAETTEPVTEHVHEFVDEIIPATCTTVGKVISKCECGEIGNETEIPLADHTASGIDCDKDTVCTVCNAVLAEKTGHIFSATEVVTAATCSAAGKEKGSCVICGKIIETEIPAAGHVATGDIKYVDGNFKADCSVCSQNVTLKAQDAAYLLNFEGDWVMEAAKYDVGLSAFKTEDWKTAEVNGSNALTVAGNKPLYINITDSAKLTALGSFVISFDYTTTAVPAANSPAASAISILNNHQNGVKTDAGSVGWGWLIKIVESGDKGYIATVAEPAKLTAENSFAIERNVKYNVQIVVSPAEKGAHVFVNGTYIGKSAPANAVSSLAPNNAAIRFGDGPDCGHVFDNLAISALK